MTQGTLRKVKKELLTEVNMKSPLKDAPLNNPGQSTDKFIQKYFENKIEFYIILSVIFFVLAGTEWVRWYLNATLSPRLFTLIAFIVISFSIYKIIKGRKKLKQLKQGLEGEIAVGQYLETFRESGAKVFHDIPADGFNLDHVVISPNGIFMIETKTFSKPSKGKTEIFFNGEGVAIKGRRLDSRPLIQAKAAAGWLKNLLKESTGRSFNVQPVVLFPGWFIKQTEKAKEGPVWVLNPKALPNYITNNSEQLKSEDVHLASFHLSRYIRSCLK